MKALKTFQKKGELPWPFVLLLSSWKAYATYIAVSLYAQKRNTYHTVVPLVLKNISYKSCLVHKFRVVWERPKRWFAWVDSIRCKRSQQQYVFLLDNPFHVLLLGRTKWSRPFRDNPRSSEAWSYSITDSWGKHRNRLVLICNYLGTDSPEKDNRWQMHCWSCPSLVAMASPGPQLSFHRDDRSLATSASVKEYSISSISGMESSRFDTYLNEKIRLHLDGLLLIAVQ